MYWYTRNLSDSSTPAAKAKAKEKAKEEAKEERVQRARDEEKAAGERASSSYSDAYQVQPRPPSAAELAKEQADLALVEAKKRAAAKITARDADRLEMRARTFKRMIFNVTAAQDLADPLDAVVKRVLTAGEKAARSSLEDATARPGELASGNKKLERHYQANATRGDQERRARTEALATTARDAPDTPARRAELATLLVEPLAQRYRDEGRFQHGTDGQYTLTPEEELARTTLGRARFYGEQLTSGNDKIRAFNQRIRNARAR